MKALDDNGLAASTLVILTSDNGPVIDDGYRDDAVEKLGSHKPAGRFRGGKYSKFEAGTRVPFVLRWPARVEHGVTSALFSQIDLIASLAVLVGVPAGVDTGPDSRNHLPAMLGDDRVGRPVLIEHAGGLAVRRGHWKLIPASTGPKKNVPTNSELGNDTVVQLYDLDADPGETNNVAEQHPDVVERLTKDLDRP